MQMYDEIVAFNELKRIVPSSKIVSVLSLLEEKFGPVFIFNDLIGTVYRNKHGKHQVHLVYGRVFYPEKSLGEDYLEIKITENKILINFQVMPFIYDTFLYDEFMEKNGHLAYELMLDHDYLFEDKNLITQITMYKQVFENFIKE